MTDTFLRILNMGITAGWVVLAVLLVRLMLRKAPKWISCVLWALVALRLVLPFTLQSGFSLIPSPEVIPQDIVITVTPQIQTGIPAVNDALNPVIARQDTGVMQELLSVACWIWLAGMGLMLLYSAVSYLRLRWQVHQSLREQGNIYICDYVRSPFILGVIRPKIYLPSGMEETQRQYVLAHENAHLKRLDHFWKPLGFLLLSVYWFNPLLWIGYVLMCRNIEQACDEKVIAPMDSAHKKGYSEALMACSVSRRTIMACPVAFGELSVKARIRGVLSYKKPAFWIMLLSVAACAAIALCFLTNPMPCQHTYESRITMDATCTQAGQETFTCSQCGHYYKEPVAMLSHTYDTGTVIAEASCIQSGTMEYCCTGCGITKSESIEKTAHTPGQLTVEKLPNCTQTGIQTAQCTVCAEVCVTEIIATDNTHDMQQTSRRRSTCAEAGEVITTCTRCGYTESTALPLIAHNNEYKYLISSDCEIASYVLETCLDCGHEYKKLMIPASEHNWSPYYNYCTRCRKIKPGSADSGSGRTILDDLNHNVSNDPQDGPPVIIWDYPAYSKLP